MGRPSFFNGASDKRSLRRQAKKARNAMDADLRPSIDAAIERRICRLPEFSEADVVFSYLSFGSEVETRGIIGEALRRGKTVALPRCGRGPRELQWFAVHDLGDLEPSPFGIEEPRFDPSRELQAGQGGHELAIVAGLTFDARGHRLGYGGGYYDAFLASFAGTSVGPCRAGFLSDGPLPYLEDHDVPVDIVVCEDRAIRRAKNQ